MSDPTLGLQVTDPAIAPSGFFAAVTPSDSTTYTGVRSVWVGTSGDLAVVPALPGGGSAVTFVSVLSGTWLPISVQKVMSTNTTASNIVVLY